MRLPGTNDGAVGEASRSTRLESPPNDTPRSTDGTPKIVPLLTEGENHLAVLILGFQ